MWHATWNRLLHNKGRLTLTMFAVAIGVTFLTASLVLARSTQAALDDSYAQVYAGVDVVARGPEPIGESPFGNGAAPLDDTAVDDIRDTAGVAHVEGRLSSVAQLSPSGSDGAGEGAIAVAVPGDPFMAALQLRSGRLPKNRSEVAVDAAAATALDLHDGDRVDVLLPSRSVNAVVTGTVGFGRLDGLAGGARVLFDRQTAQTLFGNVGYADIVVRAEDGVPPDVLRHRIAAVLGDDAQVMTAVQAAARDAAAASRQTALVGYIVLAVAVVALLIGGFLIANTFRMLVGQRVRELALLRALGATRRQVAASVVAEAAVTGALGALTGVALGVGAGAVLVQASTGLMPGLPAMSATITPGPIAAGLVSGVAVAMVAGRGAARRALAVPPVAAMRTVAVDEAGPSRLRLAGGVVVALLAAALVFVGVDGAVTVLVILGAAVTIVAAGLLFPFFTGTLLATLSGAVAHAGIAGGLARQQTLSAPRRAGATAAALAVTLGLVTLLLVVNASIGAATPALLAQRQHAEFTIRSTARQGLHDLLFDVADDVGRLPEVATARVVTYGAARIADPGSDGTRQRTASVFIVDPTAAAELFDVHDVAGRVATLTTGDIAVRDTLAAAEGWDLGDQLDVTFPDGTRTAVTLSAVFTGAVSTDWIASPATAQSHYPAAYREAFARLGDGTSIDVAAPAIKRVVAVYPSTTALSRDELVAQTREANESSLGILTALFSLSLVIGVIGIVNTLSLAVLERVHELGLLRAVGATRGQVRSIILWEAVLTSTLGAVMGAGLGIGIAWIATRAMPDNSVAFTVPLVHLSLAVVATAVLGVVAALFPAWRASRIDVLQAIQTQ